MERSPIITSALCRRSAIFTNGAASSTLREAMKGFADVTRRTSWGREPPDLTRNRGLGSRLYFYKVCVFQSFWPIHEGLDR